MKTAILSLDASLSFVQRIKEIELLIEKSAKEGVNLVLLPELSYCGYTVDSSIFAKHSFGNGLNFFSSLAKKHSVYIGFGVAKRSGERYKNSYVVVSSKGETVCVYDKIHIFSFANEDAVFDGGDRLCIFELDGLKIGISICYDLRFPEIFSLYADRCDVVLCPSAWPKKRIGEFKLLLKARAVENRISMIGINWLGGEYLKSSFVTDAIGMVQKPLVAGRKLDIYEILAKNTNSKTPNRVNDKRFDLYVKFIGERV